MSANPYTGAETVYRKGARIFGEALPYLQRQPDGKDAVIYGSWWTEARLLAMSSWIHACEQRLPWVCGSDDAIARDCRIRVVTRSRAHLTESGAFSLVAALEITKAAPTQAEQEQIDMMAIEAIRAREGIRAWITQRPKLMAKLGLALPADAWDSRQLAAAVLRDYELMIRLADADFLPRAIGLVPETQLAGAQ